MTRPAHHSLLLALAAVLLVMMGGTASALDDGLARTPPMGWNSWNTFRLNINENLVRQVADVIVEKGLKDAGYEYLVIDDGWQIARDEEGNIVADPEKFPSGIKALADYAHSRGLKFGLYSDAGARKSGTSRQNASATNALVRTSAGLSPEAMYCSWIVPSCTSSRM